MPLLPAFKTTRWISGEKHEKQTEGEGRVLDVKEVWNGVLLFRIVVGRNDRELRELFGRNRFVDALFDSRRVMSRLPVRPVENGVVSVLRGHRVCGLKARGLPMRLDSYSVVRGRPTRKLFLIAHDFFFNRIQLKV